VSGGDGLDLVAAVLSDPFAWGCGAPYDVDEDHDSLWQRRYRCVERGALGQATAPKVLTTNRVWANTTVVQANVLAGGLRQRCLIHRARNLLATVPRHAQGQVKAEYWAIFDDVEAAPGTAAVTEVTRRANAFATKWRKLYRPSNASKTTSSTSPPTCSSPSSTGSASGTRISSRLR
jgi:Transposase, Mutator family